MSWVYQNWSKECNSLIFLILRHACQTYIIAFSIFYTEELRNQLCLVIIDQFAAPQATIIIAIIIACWAYPEYLSIIGSSLLGWCCIIFVWHFSTLDVDVLTQLLCSSSTSHFQVSQLSRFIKYSLMFSTDCSCSTSVLLFWKLLLHRLHSMCSFGTLCTAKSLTGNEYSVTIFTA